MLLELKDVNVYANCPHKVVVSPNEIAQTTRNAGRLSVSNGFVTKNITGYKFPLLLSLSPLLIYLIRVIVNLQPRYTVLYILVIYWGCFIQAFRVGRYLIELIEPNDATVHRSRKLAFPSHSYKKQG